MVNVGIIQCCTGAGGSEVFQDSINKAWLHYSIKRTVDHTHELCRETPQETNGKIQATYRNSELLHVSALQLSLCANIDFSSIHLSNLKVHYVTFFFFKLNNSNT